MESMEKIGEVMNKYQEKTEKLNDAIKNAKENKQELPIEEVKQIKQELNDLKSFIEQQRDLFLKQMEAQRALFAENKK